MKTKALCFFSVIDKTLRKAFLCCADGRKKLLIESATA